MTGVITPSSLWQGSPVAGSRWTREQLGALAREGVQSPERVATAAIERRAKVHPENWTLPPPIERLVLPRLALNRAGTRAKVVLPAGAVQWIEVKRG